MRRLVTTVAATAGLAAIVMTASVTLWVGLGGLGLLAAAVFWFARCHHPGPLGLLPATVDFNGVPVPARWYCDQCGLERPAIFEKTHTPIQRFAGYDQDKAVSAARRAEALTDGRRALALERAGLLPASGPSPVRRRGGVVPIGSRRSLAR